MEKHSFQEVMKEWKRMCGAIQEKNRRCGMAGFDFVPCANCPLANKGCKSPDIANTQIVEEEIMKWAAMHREMEYPTWGEWLNKHEIVNKIIDNGALIYEPVEKMKQPIPADIAQKLGIEPKEGSMNMNHCKYCTYYEPEWAYCFKYGNHVLDDDGCEKFKPKEG